MQRVVSEVCLSSSINLFVFIFWAGMLMIKKMGIRGINLEKRYQATEFSTVQHRQIYAAYGNRTCQVGFRWNSDEGEFCPWEQDPNKMQHNSQANWIV